MISNVAGDRLYNQIYEKLNDAYHKIHTSGNWSDGEYCRSSEQKLKQITGKKNTRPMN